MKATFFLTNIWLDDYPEMAKKIAAAGHEIAMHSVSHPHMSQISAEEVARELDGNYQRIVEVTGYTPELFRFPFGEYDNKSIDVVRAKGFYPIQWSIDSLDWMESKTAGDLIDRVTLGLHPARSFSAIITALTQRRPLMSLFLMRSSRVISLFR